MSTATEALAALVRELPPSRGRRTSHVELCAAFYALHGGAPQTLVAKAVGLTAASVSLLKNCRKATSTHYLAIAREFERLGETEFGRTYYTDDFHDRLMRIKQNVAKFEDIRIRIGPNFTSDKYAGPHTLIDRQGEPQTINIFWANEGEFLDPADDVTPLPPGWTFLWTSPPERDASGLEYYSGPHTGRYRTSGQAFDAAHEQGFAVPTTRPQPGRPRKFEIKFLK